LPCQRRPAGARTDRTTTNRKNRLITWVEPAAPDSNSSPNVSIFTHHVGGGTFRALFRTYRQLRKNRTRMACVSDSVGYSRARCSPKLNSTTLWRSYRGG